MNYGIQMYSLRDITGENLDAALGAVAEMGYKYVEFAGYFGHSAEEVKAMLDKHGLTCSSTHAAFDDLINHFEETVNYHLAIGCKKYIVPAYDLYTKEKLDDFIEKANIIAEKLAPYGIELGYHNHNRELEALPDGTVIYDELYNRADIFLELDVFWSYVAGVDPLLAMDKYGSKLKFIHLKDGTRDGHGLSLGQGEVDIKSVVEKAKKCGYTMVVESEGLNPTGKEEVARCIDYLKTID